MAAGFGLDLERCDPEVFAAVEEELSNRAREQRRDELANELKRKMGGKA